MAKIGIISFYNLDVLDNGGKIRSYNIAKELNKKHKVFFLMPARCVFVGTWLFIGERLVLYLFYFIYVTVVFVISC